MYKGMFLGLLRASSLREKLQQLLEEKASILELAGVFILCLYYLLLVIIVYCGIISVRG